MKGFFVTGTDTGVGKTVVSAGLVSALRLRGERVVPWKPVAAGAERIGDAWMSADTHALLAAAGLPASEAPRVTRLLLREPLAPHIAAAREGRGIDLAELIASWHALAPHGDVAIVEGVGGFRVPLDARHDTADLAQALALPVLLVVGLRLGCINHALLTADAIGARGLRLAGWIANAIDPAMAAREENVATLVERLGAPLVGRIAHGRTDHAAVAADLDVDTLLARA